MLCIVEKSLPVFHRQARQMVEMEFSCTRVCGSYKHSPALRLMHKSNWSNVLRVHTLYVLFYYLNSSLYASHEITTRGIPKVAALALQFSVKNIELITVISGELNYMYKHENHKIISFLRSASDNHVRNSNEI